VTPVANALTRLDVNQANVHQTNHGHHAANHRNENAALERAAGWHRLKLRFRFAIGRTPVDGAGSCARCGCTRLRAEQDLVRGADEAVHVMVEIAPGIDLHGIAIGKFTDIFGKLAWLRHISSANQQWDDRDMPIERSLDLNTHIIGLGVDSGMAVSAAARPARPHDDHQHVAVLNA
jgi:hypothetical protein